MRPFGIAGPSLLLLAGCASAHEEHGPAGILYACMDGSDARVVYWAGGASAPSRARVEHGGQVHALTAVPAEYGLRYVSSDGATIVTWTVNGEDASLSTIASDAPADAVPYLIGCPRRRDGPRPGDPGPSHMEDPRTHR
ncbi:MAG TPA: MliC family protein [Allosphingosinicella sp.]|nr:MliC family protein [Allosphingosinicella sp.]